MNTATPQKYKKLLYRNENYEVFMITNYFYIFPYDNKTLQVWQFKNYKQHNFCKEYKGFIDSIRIQHFKIPNKDLSKLVEIGWYRKRRNLKTIQRLCSKIGCQARPYNGKTLFNEDNEQDNFNDMLGLST